MPDGIVHVNTGPGVTSGTSGGRPQFETKYIYTVWMEDPSQNSAFAYARTTDRRKADRVAELISGFFTREEVIGDYRGRVSRG